MQIKLWLKELGIPPYFPSGLFPPGTHRFDCEAFEAAVSILVVTALLAYVDGPHIFVSDK